VAGYANTPPTLDVSPVPVAKGRGEYVDGHDFCGEDSCQVVTQASLGGTATWLIAVVASASLAYRVACNEAFESTVARTADAPVEPKGILRGTWTCSALTRHSMNRH